MSRILSRRTFLKHTGTAVLAAALAGTLTGCIPSHIPVYYTFLPSVGGLNISAKLSHSTAFTQPATYTFSVTLENSQYEDTTVYLSDFSLQLEDGSTSSPEKWNADASSFTLAPGEEQTVEVTFQCESDAEKLFFKHNGEYIYYSMDRSTLTIGKPGKL